MQKIKDYSLYLVITEKYGKGRTAIEIARTAITGGVDIIQMREKDMPRAEIIDLGKSLSKLCKDSGVMFIVNDDPEIAKETNADGVHLGQEDIKEHSIESVRSILGRDRIIGISTHSVEVFNNACTEDVDYIAYGPVFPTAIKNSCVGIESVGKIMTMTDKPVFFIGGITLDNIRQLITKGAKNVSLIRAIAGADDIASAAKSFKMELKDAKKRA